MAAEPIAGTVHGARRETVLVLVDEIRQGGLCRRSRALIGRLARHLDIVLIAQCYLGWWHPARWLRMRSALYGFPAEGFEENVRAFATRITSRHRPSWAIAYGWENSQLVGALDRLNLPVVSFTDYRSTPPDAEGQIRRIFSSAAKILFVDETIPDSLTNARWELEARHYSILPNDASTIDSLVSAGREAVAERAVTLRQQALDTKVIETAGGLDLDLAIRQGDDPREAIAIYLRASQSVVPRNRIFAGRLLRRPIAGFNPLIYASDNSDFDDASGEDPLAHFIRSGRPPGRWLHDVIRPRPDAAVAQGIAAAIHVHLHYPDLLPELLERLSENRSKPDLVITTTSEDRRAEIEGILGEARVEARSIVVCENRGRDLWPFIELLRSGALQAYDVIGHVHGKRSPHYELGQQWRDFLWTHLIGGTERMVDCILDRFAADDKLGLVFAEEPHLEGWEMDLEAGSDLARRAGIPLPLPFHFDYPMGTMFWARREALGPLLSLGLTRDEIPAEPLPIDGTILHALERLLPFLVVHAGFECATTVVAGSRR